MSDIRYRRRRSSKINPNDYDAEAGDLCVFQGRLGRYETPTGWHQLTRGWLYSRRIKAPDGMMAIVRNGEIYWTPKRATKEQT